MTALFGGNEALGVLMAATIGAPLYARGGGTIPLLQQWLYDGMSMGSAAAFMVTGPATKITNLGALKIVLRVRKFLLYLLLVMAFAFASGLVADRVFRVRESSMCITHNALRRRHCTNRVFHRRIKLFISEVDKRPWASGKSFQAD